MQTEVHQNGAHYNTGHAELDLKRIERLNADLLERTGIDFSRYRDPDLSEAIGNAMTFPLYLGRSLSGPVGWLLLLLLVAFLVTEGAFLKTLLFFPGILLTIVIGVLFGLVLFVGRVRTDMKKVFEISSNLCVQALKDISAARNRMQGGGSFPGVLEIFQGINAIVILPTVIETLKSRVPFAGRLGAWVTGRFFTVVDNRLAASIAKRAPEPPSTDQPREPEFSGWLDETENAVRAVQSTIARVVDAVGRVVAMPFLVALVVVALVSLGLFYGAWKVSG